MSIPWGWESYGEYLAATEKLGGFAVNMAGMVGHYMLRSYVMGVAAWDRADTTAVGGTVVQAGGELTGARPGGVPRP